MKFEIKHCSVLDSGAEVIVNAANNNLSYGGGVCGAIFEKAGVEDLEYACSLYGFVETGDAVITDGFKSGAKYIIHSVGPNIWQNPNDWKDKLSAAYKRALELADDKAVKSIAFPCISTGIFGCPIEDATKIAIRVVSEFQPTSLDKCYFCCYTKEELNIYNRYLKC